MRGLLIATLMAWTVVLAAAVPAQAGSAEMPDESRVSHWNEALNGPLPRWREGQPPVLDPDRSLLPYAAGRRHAMKMPTSGLIASPPEYAPAEGVLFRYSSGAWPLIVADCVSQLTGDANHDEIAYVLVYNAAQENTATNQFLAAGADLSKVQFITMPSDSIWLRDYGPHFIWQAGTRAIVDSHYYPTRSLDNFTPTLLGDDYFHMPTYDIGLYYSGGNFQPGPNRSGFMTTLVNLDNPGFGDTFIEQLMAMYQGIDVMHFMPQLPFSVDGTGHIDMWMYIVDQDTVIISEFLPGSNSTAIQITDNAVPYMENLGFEVLRTPALNGYHPYDSNAHFTYTNAFRVNDRIFVPTYGSGGTEHLARDAQALAVWQAAAPDAQIVPIDSWDIIWAAGAIHCIVMQVPRYTGALPAAHVAWPDGGELLVGGNTYNLLWAADDDLAVEAVDLLYSVDGGATFPYVIAEDLEDHGTFAWTVPITSTDQALIMVVAGDGQGNSAETLSEGTFDIASATQTIYDFSAGAGVDRWAWGYQTNSWDSLDEHQHPGEVSAELSSDNYERIAFSDATGPDSDPNRYTSTFPSSGHESTHIFEFTIAEEPASILDLGIVWEGYADDCTQAELYIWNHAADNWADGRGHSGENLFMDNFAGNRDEVLTGNIREDIDRYIDGDGIVTLLVYAERSSDRSFHDYVAVTVTVGADAPGDLTGDGLIDAADLAVLLGSWGPCPGCPADLNNDAAVNAADLALLLGNWN